MLFEYLKKIFPRIGKGDLLRDIGDTKTSLAETAIPMTQAANDVLRLRDSHSRVYERFNEIFHSRLNLRKDPNFLPSLEKLLDNALKNLQFVEKRVKETLEESNYSDQISAEKAQLIRAATSISSISDLTIRGLENLLRAENAVGEKSMGFSSKEESVLLEEWQKLCHLLSAFGREPALFEKSFKSIPDVVITPENMSHVEGLYARSIDPFHEAEGAGFTLHPIVGVRELVADLLIWRYDRQQKTRTLFENRIQMLRLQQNGDNTAALEKQIRFYEDQVIKLTDKINAFEKKYGG